MVFSSIPFLYYFLPAVLAVYFLTPRKGKNAVLLLASLIFYGWGELRLLPLIRALFREVNPIPVKAAMELLGWDCGRCRLPLTRATEETVVELKKLLPREI